MLEVASENARLIENLRIAYEAEANTQCRYLAFAQKADGEGWHGVASLFRAAARAEQVHAGNHGRILNQLRGYRPFELERSEIKTTLENLRSAVRGECFEVETMYPKLLQHARSCHDPAVTRTFHWALQAEKTHARLFEETLDLVEMEDEDSWITMARTFLVCPVCGYSSEDPCEAEMCPVCNCAWKKFEAIR
jgi:rubrerythrin